MSIYGGAENVVRELSLNLIKNGIDNLVITLNISEEVKKTCEKIKIVTPETNFPYKFRSTNFFSAVGIFREIAALRKLVKAYASQFDLINVHNFPAYWVVYGLKKPIVWMCNEPPDLWNNPNPSLIMRILRFIGIVVDRFIVNRYVNEICVADELNAQRVKTRYNRNSTIIPYGIDYEVFTRNYTTDELDELFAQYKIDKNEFILLQVGVISPQKNQIESIKALKVLLENNYNVKLILSGRNNTPYKRYLDRFIYAHKLTDRVIFTGHLPKSIVAKLYQIAHVCLFPVKEQGGWLAPFEALLCGKPVVVSSTVGAASLIKKYDFGMVSDDFSTAILEVFNNYDMYLSKAKRGSTWVRENLTWENFTTRMLKVFEKALLEYGKNS
jgi:glycosyltransferase involved in cell wall biosynthesis